MNPHTRHNLKQHSKIDNDKHHLENEMLKEQSVVKFKIYYRGQNKNNKSLQ